MEVSPQNWPNEKRNLLFVNNQFHNVAIITLWSKKEIYIKNIDNNLYNTIGQLYSKEEGLNILLRNLLANKYITELIIVGADLNDCGYVLKSFFEKGFNKNGKVICDKYNIFLDKNFSLNSLNRLRKNVKIHDLRKVKDYDLINDYLKKIPKKDPYFINEVFEKEDFFSKNFSFENNVFDIRTNYVGEAWYKSLLLVNKYGFKPNPELKRKEVVSLSILIDKEITKNIKWYNEFDFSIDFLDEFYFDDIIEKINFKNFSNEIIIQNNIFESFSYKELLKVDFSKFYSSKGKLHMFNFINKVDLDKFPKLVFILRKLQELVSVKLNINLGDLILFLDRPFLSEITYSNKYLLNKVENSIILERDPNGSILIEVNLNLILISYLDSKGNKFHEFSSTSANSALKKISKDMIISNVSHALDIGSELQKAEIAIKLNLPYIQDNELFINNVSIINSYKNL